MENHLVAIIVLAFFVLVLALFVLKIMLDTKNDLEMYHKRLCELEKPFFGPSIFEDQDDEIKELTLLQDPIYRKHHG